MFFLGLGFISSFQTARGLEDNSAPLEIMLVEYTIHIFESDLENSVLLQKYSSLDLTHCPFPLFYYSYIVLRRSVGSICVKVKSKKWTTNDCEEEEKKTLCCCTGKDGKISMGSFPAKKMLWCFVSRIIHKRLGWCLGGTRNHLNFDVH